MGKLAAERVLRAFAIALGLAPMACSALLDDDYGRETDVRDGAPTTNDDAAEAPYFEADASSDEPVDAAPEGGPLGGNGDFEQTGSGCGPFWAPLENTAIASVSSARTGSHACSVCATTADTFYGIYQALPAPLTSSHYELSAYLRLTGSGDRLHATHLYIRKTNGTLRYAPGELVGETGAWRAVAVYAAIGSDESVEGFDVHSRGSTGDCFTTDDVALRITQ